MKYNKAITIFLIILLIAGFLFIFSEFKKLSKEGLACQSQPFIWGARSIVKENPDNHMFCSCQIYSKEGFKTYSFDENQENPPPIFDEINIIPIKEGTKFKINTNDEAKKT